MRKSEVFGFDSSKLQREVRAAFRSEVRQAFTTLFYETVQNTPVHSGKTLRNWRASVGTPAQTDAPAIESPSDPGRTSRMPLGSEPRRGANMRDPEASFIAIDFSNPFQQFWIANASVVDDADPISQSGYEGASRAELVEYGSLPTHTEARNQPAGSLRLAIDKVLGGPD